MLSPINLQNVIPQIQQEQNDSKEVKLSNEQIKEILKVEDLLAQITNENMEESRFEDVSLQEVYKLVKGDRQFVVRNFVGGADSKINAKSLKIQNNYFWEIYLLSNNLIIKILI